MALRTSTFALLVGLTAGMGAPHAEPTCAALYEQARKTRAVDSSGAALRSCTALADRGDPEGRYLLGLLRLHGIGTPPDSDAGIALIRAAAEAGYGAAQAQLGRLLLRGEGVASDPAAAAAWFERAAGSGDPLAQYELGQLLYKGVGVPVDPYEAYKWFSAAAENYARIDNVPRRKLAERKKETLAAQLPAGERERADAWVKENTPR